MRRLIPLAGLVAALAALPAPSVRATDAAAPIAVVVSAAQPRNVRPSDLALIFRRKKLFWSDGSKVNPVNLPARSPLRGEFSRVVLGASPEELEKYWNDMYFHGLPPPFVLGSDEAVLRFVAQTPGAIGYVSYCSVDTRVVVALVISTSGQLSPDSGTISCGRSDSRKTPQ